MELSFWAATDVGKKREANEDNFLVDKALSLFIVADGMGGHASGEVASQLAVHEFRNAVEAGRETVEGYAKDERAVRPQDVLTLLEGAVQTAGQAVYHKGQAEPEKRGMGTTTSALLIAGDRGFIAHVGDSRIYMLRGGQVVQLTEDHSLVNELIRRGRVTKENFDTSPYKAYKNAVTRAVGVYETVQGDTIDFEILPGDQFLLCSDGLHAYLNDQRIVDSLKGDDVKALPKKLIDLANAGGGHDNITAIVVRVERPEAATGAAPVEDRAEELARKVDVLRRMPLFRHLIYKEILRVLNVTDGQGVRARRGDHQGGDPGGRDVRAPEGQAPAAQERRVHHRAGARGAHRRDGADRSAAAPLGQRDGRGAFAPADPDAGRISTRSFARSRSCRPSCSGRSPR